MKFYIFVNVVLLIVLADNIIGDDPVAKPIIAPIPPRCRRIACPAINCRNGYIPKKLPTECCPSCRRDCSVVSCIKEICKYGLVSVTPAGECCPRCQIDCNFVDCIRDVPCPAGQISVVHSSGCCGQCVPLTEIKQQFV